jgi:dihydroflavonol-4-reductase
MILVTGGTGLVGNYLLAQLVAQGKQVRALYRSSIPTDHANTAMITWVQGDILDYASLQDAMEGCTQLYHCAATVSFHPKRKAELFKINVEGTANVVNAALETGIQKMVHVSSVAALGRIRTDGMVNETMNWTPETSNSVYGQSKYMGEMEVWRGIGEGLNAVVVNPSIILGAGDWNKGSSEIFKSAYEEFPWYAGGTSGFVDVRDVVRAMVMLMDSEIQAQRFIVSGHNAGYREVFEKIARAFGKKPPHRAVTPFLAGLVWRWEGLKSRFTGKEPLLTKETAVTAQAKVYFDNSKIKAHLPGFDFTPLADTIADACARLVQINGLSR